MAYIESVYCKLQLLWSGKSEEIKVHGRLYTLSCTCVYVDGATRICIDMYQPRI
jgi:hypothetical protein